MKALRTLLRTLSGTVTASGSLLPELTGPQLDHVVGGGPKPGAATGGTDSLINTSNGDPKLYPDSGRGGVGAP